MRPSIQDAGPKSRHVVSTLETRDAEGRRHTNMTTNPRIQQAEQEFFQYRVSLVTKGPKSGPNNRQKVLNSPHFKHWFARKLGLHWMGSHPRQIRDFVFDWSCNSEKYRINKRINSGLTVKEWRDYTF